jgi:hypothetical protein
MTIILRHLPGLEKGFMAEAWAPAVAGYALIDRAISRDFKQL